jgi:hypothetical protein
MSDDAEPTDAADGPDAGPDDPDDATALARYAGALAEGIEAALPGWVVGCVERILVAHRGQMDPEERRAAEAAGLEAVADVGPRVRTLLLTDIDEQRTSPLALVRGAVRYPTAVLEQAGVPAVERDPFTVRQFPDDPYDLTPASFADLDPDLLEPGLTWGAAKAHVHLARRRREGRR